VSRRIPLFFGILTAEKRARGTIRIESGRAHGFFGMRTVASTRSSIKIEYKQADAENK
jgi:hypothetical protein